MNIQSVYHDDFRPYGRVLAGYDTAGLAAAMAPFAPSEGVEYEPSVAPLEREPIFTDLQDRAFGGLPIQIGLCWGRNTRLNCLEYHRDSEVNIGTHDFILLLAKRQDMADGRLDTASVRAFLVPGGVAVEVYATTLHYAPCHVRRADGFRVAIVLPQGTNTAKPVITPGDPEDKLLWARNKWLIAHAESAEAGQGAALGLVGANLDVTSYINREEQ